MISTTTGLEVSQDPVKLATCFFFFGKTIWKVISIGSKLNDILYYLAQMNIVQRNGP